MLRLIVIILMTFFALRFIFQFLLPIIKTTRQMKDRVREYNNRMEQENRRDERQAPASEQPSKKAGDYIDYEEVK